MRELIALVFTARRTAALAVTLGVVSGASGAGLIWLISETLTGGLRWGALWFAMFAALALLTRIAFISMLGRLHEGAVLALRQRLARRILATPLLALEDTGSARLQATLTADVFVLGEGFRLMPSFFINLTSALGCLAYLAWLSAPVFLAMLAFGAIGVLTYWLPTQRAVRLSEQTREREDDLFRHLRSLTEGIKELSLHRGRRRAFLEECLDPTAEELRRLAVRSNDIYGATASWGLSLFFLLIGLVLFGLPQLHAVSARTLTGYAFAILFLQQPLSVMLEVLPILNRGAVALRKIRALGIATDDEADQRAAQTAAPEVAPRGFAQLRLAAVTHSYHREHEDDRFTLGPIDLTLKCGELLFLVGGNGSGKTTLAKLLTGLYRPEGGVIELDGVAVTDADRESYRQLFAAVFSDFHLFESLLGLAHDAGSAARVPYYLGKLHLEHKVRITAGRFSTTSLSQGQRKRLALLAAYLEDRPIYLFDEWAADQDPTFKAVFYQELLPELRAAGKTVVVISHDDRYFHVADRVLRLEHGRLHVDRPLAISPSPVLSRKGEAPCPPSTI